MYVCACVCEIHVYVESTGPRAKATKVVGIMYRSSFFEHTHTHIYAKLLIFISMSEIAYFPSLDEILKPGIYKVPEV